MHHCCYKDTGQDYYLRPVSACFVSRSGSYVYLIIIRRITLTDIADQNAFIDALVVLTDPYIRRGNRTIRLYFTIQIIGIVKRYIALR